MESKRALTWLAYLVYFFLGMAFVSQGVFIIRIAQSYGMHVGVLGCFFFILVLCQALATFVDGRFLDRSNLKLQILAAFGCLVAGYLLALTDVFPLLVLGMVPVGIAYGLLLDIPNHILINLYPQDRFAKLNILNFSFSAGGVVAPFLVGHLLAFGKSWQELVAASLVVIGVLAVYTWRIPFSRLGDSPAEPPSSENRKSPSRRRNWPFTAWLIIFGMGFYIVSENVLSLWIVYFLESNYSYGIPMASSALTIFWLFIALGRFAFNGVANHVPLPCFILASTLLALLSFPWVLAVSSPILVLPLMAITGLGYASLYASLMTYGLSQTDGRDPKLMSVIVLASTIGGLLAVPLSSYFVHHYDVSYALWIAIGMQSALFIVILLSFATARALDE
jgi:MFS family permease